MFGRRSRSKCRNCPFPRREISNRSFRASMVDEEVGMPVARSTIQACLKQRRQPVVMAAADDVTDEAGAAAFGLFRVKTSSDEGGRAGLGGPRARASAYPNIGSDDPEGIPKLSDASE
jgi:hypothetical protein